MRSIRMLEQLKPLVTFLVLAILFSLVMSAECGCIPPRQVKLPVDSYLLIQHELSFKVCEGKVCTVKTAVHTGSGFVIHNVKGGSWALTAGHVCATPEGVVSSKVHAVSRGSVVRIVTATHVLPNVDICAFYMRGVTLPPLRVAQNAPQWGDKSYSLSSPYGIYDTELVPKFEGYYAGKAVGVPNPHAQISTFPELDAYTIPSRPGSSGGPIFNAMGALVGMVIMANPLLENFSLSPPSLLLREIVAAIKDGSAKVPE
jgi:hypothetical protein